MRGCRADDKRSYRSLVSNSTSLGSRCAGRLHTLTANGRNQQYLD